MKKKLAVLLSALMLVSCLPVAAAAEQPANVNATELLEELGLITAPEDYDDTDWAAEWAAELREEKVQAGMPYLDGINVSLNGEYLSFGGVAPISVERRTMVPFRAFLEQAGAKVDIKDGVISAKLPSGDSLELRLDSTTLTYTTGDKINKIDMGVTPYVSGGHTYIPARFAGEALGLAVVWDSEYQVVHLTDWDGLAAEIDGRFTNLNALLAAERTARDGEKTYADHIGITAAGTLYGENRHDTATLTVAADGVSQGTKLDASYTMKLNQGGMRDTIFSNLTEDQQKIFDLISNLKVDLRGDLAEGNLYLRSDQLFQMLDTEVPKGAWLSTEEEGSLGELFDSAIFTTVNDQAEHTTVGALATGSARGSEYHYGVDTPYEEVMDEVKWLELVFGDGAITTRTSGKTVTYTTEMDTVRLIARGITLGLADADTLAEMFPALPGGKLPDIKYTVTVRVRDGKVLDSKITGNLSIHGTTPMEVRLDLATTATTATGTLHLSSTYGGKVECKLDAKTTETTKPVLTAPAKGETVVDMNALDRRE